MPLRCRWIARHYSGLADEAAWQAWAQAAGSVDPPFRYPLLPMMMALSGAGSWLAVGGLSPAGSPCH